MSDPSNIPSFRLQGPSPEPVDTGTDENSGRSEESSDGAEIQKKRRRITSPHAPVRSTEGSVWATLPPVRSPQADVRPPPTPATSPQSPGTSSRRSILRPAVLVHQQNPTPSQATLGLGSSNTALSSQAPFPEVFHIQGIPFETSWTEAYSRRPLRRRASTSGAPTSAAPKRRISTSRSTTGRLSYSRPSTGRTVSRGHVACQTPQIMLPEYLPRWTDLPIKDKFFIPRPTLENVIGMDAVLKKLCNFLLHFRNRELYLEKQVHPPTGLLLHGPSGCGKTHLAHCIAGDLDVPMVEFSAHILSQIRKKNDPVSYMLQAIYRQPCVVFVDDFENNGSFPYLYMVVQQIAAWVEDCRMHKHWVLLIVATRQFDQISTLLRRTGKFENEIGFGMINGKGRLEILKHLTQGMNMGNEFPYERLAAITPGFLPLDLDALVSLAYAIAVKKEKCKPLVEGEIIILDEDSNDEIKPPSSEPLIDKRMEHPSTSAGANTERDPPENPLSVSTVEADKSADITRVDIKRHMTITELETKEYDIYHTDQPTESVQKIDYIRLKNLTRYRGPACKDGFKVSIEDFVEAINYVTPSLKREGFTTVPNISWKDVGSLKLLRDELRLAVVAPLKYPDRVEKLGLTAPKRILLYGPPGCGKTLLAKAIANEAGVNFISIKSPELLNMYGDKSARGVGLFFQRAKDSAPCVMFIDELEALCLKRTNRSEPSSSLGDVITNQLLMEMDGIEKRKDLFVLAATNRPDIIDPAVFRSGRFEKVLFVGLPNVDERNDILLTLTKKGRQPVIDSSVHIYQLAEKTQGFTGADLARLLRETALVSLRESMLSKVAQPDVLPMKLHHFEKALQTVTPSVTAEDLKLYEKFKNSF